MLLPLVGGSYLGWSLGANDAANVFGTAVGSRMLRFRTAAALCSFFLLAGAVLQGHHGIHTLDSLTRQGADAAGLAAIAAALAVTMMTLFKLPISASQAVVGAIIGIGLMQHHLDPGGLGKIVLCWVGTPLGAMVVAALIYPVLARLYNRFNLGMYRHDLFLRLALVLVGSYGAYALGANNVANVGTFFVAAGIMTPPMAALAGGLCIACGVVTFSRGVMATVGRGLVRLDAFSSLVVILAEAIAVHFYAMVGVPVSTSQAVIGAVVGVALVRGTRSLRLLRPLRTIALGWVMTPAIGCLLSMLLYFLTHLQYVGG
jgi:PiT family inorganic phosphate transporter